MAKQKHGTLYTVLFMMAVSAVFTLALAVVNELSIERIQEQEALQQKAAVLYVLNLPVPEDPAALQAEYDRLIRDEEDHYRAQDDDRLIGYAFPIGGPGLWGMMSGYAAVDPEGNTLLGMALPIHSETPGLGGRISEPWFMEQFRGLPLKAGGDSFIFRPAEGGNIDAVTGATLTSAAVADLLNEDTAAFRRTMKGGQ